MRDIRFIAKHRGGLLSKAQHKSLMHWAVSCSRHVINLCRKKTDPRLKNALSIASMWEKDKATVGDCRKAAVSAIAVANESSDPSSIAIARSVGHAVATAHMADHSVGAALYGLRAIYKAGLSVENERKWQIKAIPEEIKDMVLSIWASKEKHFKF